VRLNENEVENIMGMLVKILYLSVVDDGVEEREKFG
jgi:hypothetical protein